MRDAPSTPAESATLGSRLRAAREVASISARELDRIAGLHAGHTWAIEEGRRTNVETDTVRALAAALGIRVGWLVAGEGERADDDTIAAAVAAAQARYAHTHATARHTGTEG